MHEVQWIRGHLMNEHGTAVSRLHLFCSICFLPLHSMPCQIPPLVSYTPCHELDANLEKSSLPPAVPMAEVLEGEAEPTKLEHTTQIDSGCVSSELVSEISPGNHYTRGANCSIGTRVIKIAAAKSRSLLRALREEVLLASMASEARSVHYSVQV